MRDFGSAVQDVLWSTECLIDSKHDLQIITRRCEGACLSIDFFQYVRLGYSASCCRNSRMPLESVQLPVLQPPCQQTMEREMGTTTMGPVRVLHPPSSRAYSMGHYSSSSHRWERSRGTACSRYHFIRGEHRFDSATTPYHAGDTNMIQ